MLSSNTSAVSGDTVYIEDVFSTYLYTGTGATQTINNGIDLSTKGGLTWIKDRTAASTDNNLQDTVRGAGRSIYSDLTIAQEYFAGYGITSFNTNGFTLGLDNYTNTNAHNYASWTFRKQPKFFDVVTYTGNGTTQNIAHNLGATPGCIIVKRTDAIENWGVYHRSIGATGALRLNQTAATSTLTAYWNDTSPTSTQFTVGSNTQGNASGGTYVAYLFAHDAGGFGLTGTDNVISCGSFTGTGALQSINLGYEPQWLLVKQTSGGGGNWVLVDTMRGDSLSGQQFLYTNSAGAEVATSGWFYPEATGFNTGTSASSGATYIYIAIRRGPMKVPTDGTKVFAPVAVSVSAATYTVNAGFPTDLATIFPRIGGYASISYKWFADRLRGTDLTLSSVSTAAELSISGSVPGCYIKSDNMTGLSVNDTNGSWGGGASQSLISYNFRRAPSFFDEVCATSNGSAVLTSNHNLGVTPELIITKRRSGVSDWPVYCGALSSPTDKYLNLNQTIAATTYVGGYSVSSTSFTVNGLSASSTYVSYLFATCAGVSKVGNYTGTGTTLQINCGFAAGARFVLIKRTDSTGDWYVWDTARGIVSGNDPYLLLNSTAAEVTTTDYIDTYSAGFELSSTAPAALNASGGTYIFLAIA